jgi:hypothetical protein
VDARCGRAVTGARRAAAGYRSWLPTGVLLRLGSQVSPRELLAMALLGVILSALVRLARVLGPTAVKLFRARPVHAALRAYLKGSGSASDTATVIDAVARIEIATHDGERRSGAEGAGYPGTGSGSSSTLDGLAAEPADPPGDSPQPGPPDGAPAEPSAAQTPGEHLVRGSSSSDVGGRR